MDFEGNQIPILNDKLQTFVNKTLQKYVQRSLTCITDHDTITGGTYPLSTD